MYGYFMGKEILISTGNAEARNGGGGANAGDTLTGVRPVSGGGADRLRLPATPTTDGMAYLIADIFWPEPLAAAHNRELWKNDASGWSFDA